MHEYIYIYRCLWLAFIFGVIALLGGAVGVYQHMNGMYVTFRHKQSNAFHLCFVVDLVLEPPARKLQMKKDPL